MERDRWMIAEGASISITGALRRLAPHCGYAMGIAGLSLLLGFFLCAIAYAAQQGPATTVSKENSSADRVLAEGLAYSRLGEFDKAKESYFGSIDLNSRSAKPYLAIGADYLAQDKEPQALVWLARAVALDPTSQEALFLLSRALVNASYYETAQTYLKKYVLQQADDPKGWLLLGDAYLNDEQPENALKNYKNALRLVPQLADAHYLVGYTYYQLNDLANAKIYLNQALEINPALVNAHLRLADIAYRELKDQKARLHLQEAVATAGPLADSDYLFAKLDLREKRYDEAMTILQDSVKKYPQDQRFHYLLAQLYRNTGKMEDAKREVSVYETAEKMRELRHRYVRHSFVFAQ